MNCAPVLARPGSKSTSHSESDSRSNAIRIKPPRTPAQLPKFNVQPFQRVTNSRIFPCDRCPLLSGDYKLRGRGDITHSEQERRLVSPLLSIVCASPLLASIMFSVVCAIMRGVGVVLFMVRTGR